MKETTVTLKVTSVKVIFQKGEINPSIFHSSSVCSSPKLYKNQRAPINFLIKLFGKNRLICFILMYISSIVTIWPSVSVFYH